MSNSAAVRRHDAYTAEWKEPSKHQRLGNWFYRTSDPWCRPRETVDQPGRSRFVEIENALEGSAWIARLGEDWDGEGAKPIDQWTWDTSATVLRDAARTAHRRYGLWLPAPTITPCADGSIDLFWDSPSFTLLINVPSDPTGASEFYGERGAAKVQGPFDLAAPNFDFLRLLVEP